MSNAESDPEATIKMEDMADLLQQAAINENTEQVSSFESLYKNRRRCGNQDERRKSILKTQKGQRNNKLDRFRGILDLVQAVEKNIFQTPATHWKPKAYVSAFSHKIPNYCDVLMMSEWMYEKPSDFEENWFLVPCPRGTRMLVMAHKGITKCFNKYGNFRFECRTALPGGNPCEGQKNKFIVVLDGFFVKDSNTMYVLDILAWNECVLTDGECSFRDYWLRSNLNEIPGLETITKKNQMIFKIIPKLPCTKESLNETLMTFPYYNHNIPPVDGLLFFHKEAHYIAGETPLVGWLFPYMVKEVLGDDINVHPGFMLDRPVGYKNYVDFIEEFESTNRRKKQRKIFGPKNMETGERIEQTADVSTNGDITQEQGDNAAVLSLSDLSNIEEGAGNTKKAHNNSETETMEADTRDTNTGETMEAIDNVSAGFSNGNAGNIILLANKGGGDGEFGLKNKSETISMEDMVADLVEEKGVV